MIGPNPAADSLLATACSRMLNCSHKINCMRENLRQGDDTAYWLVGQSVADDLSVAAHALTEAYRILLGALSTLQPQKGGMIH